MSTQRGRGSNPGSLCLLYSTLYRFWAIDSTVHECVCVCVSECLYVREGYPFFMAAGKIYDFYSWWRFALFKGFVPYAAPAPAPARLPAVLLLL